MQYKLWRVTFNLLDVTIYMFVKFDFRVKLAGELLLCQLLLNAHSCHILMITLYHIIHKQIQVLKKKEKRFVCRTFYHKDDRNNFVTSWQYVYCVISKYVSCQIISPSWILAHKPHGNDFVSQHKFYFSFLSFLHLYSSFSHQRLSKLHQISFPKLLILFSF